MKNEKFLSIFVLTLHIHFCKKYPFKKRAKVYSFFESDKLRLFKSLVL